MFTNGTIATRDLLFSDHRPNILYKLLASQPPFRPHATIQSFKLTGSLIKPCLFPVLDSARTTTAALVPQMSPRRADIVGRNLMSAGRTWEGIRSRSVLGFCKHENGSSISNGAKKPKNSRVGTEKIQKFAFKTVDCTISRKLKTQFSKKQLVGFEILNSTKQSVVNHYQTVHVKTSTDCAIAQDTTAAVKDELEVFENEQIREHVTSAQSSPIARKVECGTDAPGSFEPDGDSHEPGCAKSVVVETVAPAAKEPENRNRSKPREKVSIQISSDFKDCAATGSPKAAKLSPKTPSQRVQHNFVFRKVRSVRKEFLYPTARKKVGIYNVSTVGCCSSPRAVKNDIGGASSGY